MNAAGAELLLRAQAEGRRQAIDMYHDTEGGDCAMGVLHVGVHGGDRAAAVACDERAGMAFCVTRIANRYGVALRYADDDKPCPLCKDDNPEHWTGGEQDLISHLNDEHRMFFSDIAALLGPDGVA